MNRLRLLITIPVAIVVVVFAVNNRGDADVNLWPLNIVIAWPMFIFVFIGAGIGFLLGAVLMWFSGAPLRKRARERGVRIRELERSAAQREKPDDVSAPELTVASSRPPVRKD